MGKIGVGEPTDLYRYFLPYIIYQDKDGTYLFLSREYKPVGMVPRPGDWVDYAACTQRFRVKGLTPEIAAKVSVRGSPAASWITLYHDGCRPQDSERNRRAYLKRLKLFYDSVEIENVGKAREAGAAVH